MEWLRTAPEHWEFKAARRLYREMREPAHPSDQQLSASQKYGVVPQSLLMEREDQKVVLALSGTDNFKHVDEGDFVISLRSFEGGIERSTYRGCVSPAYTVLRANHSIDENYWALLFKSTAFISALQVVTEGIRDGKNISFKKFAQIVLPVPPIAEQRAISSFLNLEVQKIDALIEEQRRLMELLKEKRQAVISQAVTKGLNPRAPMKPSGVEWLGDVPEHWSVVALKRLVSTPITDGPHETPNFLNEGVPFVSAEAVGAGWIDFSRVRSHISIEDNARFSKKYSPQLNDIFMVKSGATTGVTAIVDGRTDFNIWSPLAVIRCGQRVVPRFILNFMRSRQFLEAVSLYWSFGTQQNIGMGVIENLACPVPPLEEQVSISRFIEIRTREFEFLTAEAQKAIDLLLERRLSLVSAAVTGQIDVRQFAGKVPA